MYLTHICEWSLIYLPCRWFLFYFIFFPTDQIQNHKGVGLPTNKLLWLAVAHLFRWRWHTCSDASTCMASRPKSCSLIKHNCAPHTCPFRLLSPSPQTYPSANMSERNNELTSCSQVIVTKLLIYPRMHFLTAHCKHVGTVMALHTHKYFRWVIHLWYLPSCPHTCPVT